jgi:hypothetical protein
MKKRRFRRFFVGRLCAYENGVRFVVANPTLRLNANENKALTDKNDIFKIPVNWPKSFIYPGIDTESQP